MCCNNDNGFQRTEADKPRMPVDLLARFRDMGQENIAFDSVDDVSYEDWWKDFAYDESTDEEKASIAHYLATGEWEDDDENANI